MNSRPFLIELHSVPSQGRVAGYRISEDQSGGNGDQSKARQGRYEARTDLVRLTDRSQMKLMYGDHHQQPQQHCHLSLSSRNGAQRRT